MAEMIRDIAAEAITDSRGKPTLRVIVKTSSASGTFDVPSGASTGSREAIELRDADGRGVTKAMEIIRATILPALSGMAITEQRKIDETMLQLDGTQNKSRLGGNSMVGISAAAARAAAASQKLPLYEYLRSLSPMSPSRTFPRFFVNVINGGKHGKGGSAFQEHQILTKTEDPEEALLVAEQIETAMHRLLTESGIEFTIGDEGGVIFPVSNVDEPFEKIVQAAERAGIRDKIDVAADIAASSFYEGGHYDVLGESWSADDLQKRYLGLNKKTGLNSIEDPFEENDMMSFAKLRKANPSLLIIGDDLTTTNAESIKNAAKAGAINGVIIKVNQIGTITETLDAMKTARENDVHCIISHRSGETMDDFIADLAFAFGCYGLKAGALSAPERAVKYKRLAKIAR